MVWPELDSSLGEGRVALIGPRGGVHGTHAKKSPDQNMGRANGNPPEKQRNLKVEYSRNLTRGHSRENIPIYRQPDPGDSQAG